MGYMITVVEKQVVSDVEDNCLCSLGMKHRRIVLQNKFLVLACAHG